MFTHPDFVRRGLARLRSTRAVARVAEFAHDRAGAALLSSRLGLTHDALEVAADFDFWRYTVDALTQAQSLTQEHCRTNPWQLTSIRYHLGAAAKRYEELKIQKDQINDELKLVNAAMKELEVNIIPDLMSQAGIVNGTKGRCSA